MQSVTASWWDNAWTNVTRTCTDQTKPKPKTRWSLYIPRSSTCKCKCTRHAYALTMKTEHPSGRWQRDLVGCWWTWWWCHPNAQSGNAAHATTHPWRYQPQQQSTQPTQEKKKHTHTLTLTDNTHKQHHTHLLRYLCGCKSRRRIAQVTKWPKCKSQSRIGIASRQQIRQDICDVPFFIWHCTVCCASLQTNWYPQILIPHCLLPQCHSHK